MADACFVELTKKANLFEETGLVPVLDYAAYVIKSDTLLTQTLKNALKAAVELLEDSQKSQKDWQPGSDEKILNLVDPSIWRLVYGRSKILPDKQVPLDNCIDNCGMEEVIPQPPNPMFNPSTDVLARLRTKAFRSRFQWLPCNVDLTGEKPRIDTYINNMHPVRHAPLYSTIERLIGKSLPAWDIVCRSTDEDLEAYLFQHLRAVKYCCRVPDTCKYACKPNHRPDRVDEDKPSLDADHFVKLQASHIRHTGFFKREVQQSSSRAMVDMNKPIYEGNPWQVGGQAIERICATALFYYDGDNIEDHHISFRVQGNRENPGWKANYIYGDWLSIERIFVMDVRGTRLQEIGSVLTREGRAIFYPNVYQNRLGPFELADKTRPSHCNMLASFLVDSMNPIISTANIPPQQQD